MSAQQQQKLDALYALDNVLTSQNRYGAGRLGCGARRTARRRDL